MLSKSSENNIPTKISPPLFNSVFSNSENEIGCVRTTLNRFLPGRSLKDWLAKKIEQNFEPIYSSIDIRDAGFKLAPVDANLYPAGFNNICIDDVESAHDILIPLLKRHLGKVPERVAILPEAHTKNKFYVDNILELRHIFKRSGIETEIGFWDPEKLISTEDRIELEASDGRKIMVSRFKKTNGRLFFETEAGTFEPDFILLNNDFSSGYPVELDGISQAIEPSPKMGWHTRRKSDFFLHYNKLATDLAKEAGMDPWCMTVDTRLVTGVDFDSSQGLEKIATAVDSLIQSMQTEYLKRGINEKPFVFVKSNQGTYGMGIMKVESGAEILTMNRREKNKMAIVKNQLEVHEVIVQEGIPTRFQFDGVYAEPAIYLFGWDLMGGFLRKNPTRGRGDNLNSKGMVFQKLCLSDLRNNVDRELELELVYGTIAQLSSAAMSLEQKMRLSLEKQT